MPYIVVLVLTPEGLQNGEAGFYLGNTYNGTCDRDHLDMSL